MATTIGNREEIELQDGKVIEFRPLNIRSLRKFMNVVAKFDKIETNDESMTIMMELCQIAIEQFAPKDFDSSVDNLEEVLDIPTMEHIIEVVSGIKLNDPDLVRAAVAAQG